MFNGSISQSLRHNYIEGLKKINNIDNIQDWEIVEASTNPFTAVNGLLSRQAVIDICNLLSHDLEMNAAAPVDGLLVHFNFSRCTSSA